MPPRSLGLIDTHMANARVAGTNLGIAEASQRPSVCTVFAMLTVPEAADPAYDGVLLPSLMMSLNRLDVVDLGVTTLC